VDVPADEDFAVFARDLAAAPSAGPQAWTHNSSRAFSLHQACYELRICQQPPRMARPGKASLQQRAQQITQPGIRKAALRYLTTVASTLRPGTVDARADSLITFAEYLAARHPEVRSLTQLTRAHMEGFLAYNHGRPWRDQPVSQALSKRTVIDLRCFIDDITLWGWADRPPARMLFPADIPRLDRPLPRALAPDADRDLMAAIGRLDDPFARIGLTLLRGTGLRLGELLDLELECISAARIPQSAGSHRRSARSSTTGTTTPARSPGPRTPTRSWPVSTEQRLKQTFLQSTRIVQVTRYKRGPTSMAGPRLQRLSNSLNYSRSSKSPCLIPSAKVFHSARLYMRKGPSGFFESPIRIMSPFGAIRTQSPPLHRSAVRQES
jgi:hypothetical protein